uniref:Uncharacterized protein n=1 Tax=Romanomermis culicivorax TaxID=13658 RepID=A0A915KLZ6_ROMCU
MAEKIHVLDRFLFKIDDSHQKIDVFLVFFRPKFIDYFKLIKFRSTNFTARLTTPAPYISRAALKCAEFHKILPHLQRIFSSDVISNAVAPRILRCIVLAPAFNKVRTISKRPLIIASCKGVKNSSPPTASTTAPRFSNSSTILLSPRRAASCKNVRLREKKISKSLHK